MSKKTRRVEVHKSKSANSDWPVSKNRQDGWKYTSQSPPTATDQCQKDKMSGSAQAKVHQQWLTSVKKDKTSGSTQVKVHQQRLTNVKKDKTSGSTQVKVRQQRLTNIKKQTRRVEVHKPKSTNSDWPVSKRQDEWKRTSQSPPTVTDQCEKKTRRVGAHKSKSANSDWPMSTRQDEWESTCQSPPTATVQCQKEKKKDEWERTRQTPPTATDQCQNRQDGWKYTSQSPPTATDQCEKDKTSGSVQAKVHQQRLTSVKKDKTIGSTQVKVRQQRLTSVKKTRLVEAHKPKSTNSDWPVWKRQDEWERTSQSSPTAADQCQKTDKTGGSTQAKVHQQWLTSVKKQTRRVEVHKPNSTNSDWPVWKRQDEWKRTSQSPPTTTDQCEKRQDEWERISLPTVYPYLLQFTHNSYSLPIIPTGYP